MPRDAYKLAIPPKRIVFSPVRPHPPFHHNPLPRFSHAALPAARHLRESPPSLPWLKRRQKQARSHTYQNVIIRPNKVRLCASTKRVFFSAPHASYKINGIPSRDAASTNSRKKTLTAKQKTGHPSPPPPPLASRDSDETPLPALHRP